MASAARARAGGDLRRRLPRVASHAAAASCLLHDARFAAAWSDLAPGVELVPVAGPSQGRVRRLVVEGARGRVELLVDGSASAALSLAAAQDDELPDGLEQLAAEALFAPVLARLPRLGLPGARVVEFRPAGSGAHPDAGWCAVHTARGELARFAVTALPAPVREAALARLLRAPRAQQARAPIHLRGRVCLSERPVRRAVLNSLAPGDVLLLLAPADGLPGETRAQLRFGMPGRRSLCAPAHVGEAAVTLEGDLEMQEDSMDDTDDELSAGAQRTLAPADDPEREGVDDNSPLDSLEVPVRFEIDTVALPLARLEAMQAGQVIELAVPLSSARVRLTACGRVVALAELVAVGDQLGARITHLAAHHAEPAA